MRICIIILVVCVACGIAGNAIPAPKKKRIRSRLPGKLGGLSLRTTKTVILKWSKAKRVMLKPQSLGSVHKCDREELDLTFSASGVSLSIEFYKGRVYRIFHLLTKQPMFSNSKKWRRHLRRLKRRYGKYKARLVMHNRYARSDRVTFEGSHRKYVLMTKTVRSLGRLKTFIAARILVDKKARRLLARCDPTQ